MGILNCSPDSFYQQQSNIIERAFAMIESGADIIDVGGESTRHGATLISCEEELKRVLPVIEAIRKKSSLPISIDTTKSKVALAAYQVGATLINDVSALNDDPQMRSVAALYNMPVVLMHRRGNSQTMMHYAHYENVVEEVIKELMLSVDLAVREGIKKENIYLDPGIGFAKNTQHNLEILKNIDEFTKLKFPLVLGVSRKKFIGETLNYPDPQHRLQGSLAVAAYLMLKKIDILRVHDVQETKDVLRMLNSLQGTL